MKVALGAVVNSVEVIRKLTEAELPVKIGFRLMSLTKQLDEKLKTFEEVRGNLIRKYGEENEDKTSVQVKSENIQEFINELNSVLSEEIEVDFAKINVDHLPDSLKLTTSELAAVQWLIET